MEFTSENKNSSSAFKSSSKNATKLILAVQPMIRTKDPLTKTKEIKSTEINQHKKYSDQNFGNQNFFMDSLKFRISRNNYEKITKHETEVSAVKRKIAEIFPFIQEEPLDLRTKKNKKVDVYPKSLINYESPSSSHLQLTKKFRKG